MSAVTEAGIEIGPVYRRRPVWVAAWPLFPILIYLGILFLYPVIQLLWLSILDDAGSFSDVHYTKLIQRATYVKVLGITFRIAAWTTLFSVVAAYPVAYLLATTTVRRSPIVRESFGAMAVAAMIAASTMAMILVSLVTRPPSRETLEKFFPDS